MNNSSKKVKDFIEERGWDNQPPGDIAKSIVIEAAELLEHFQWSSFFDEDPVKEKKRKAEIIDELADVLIYAIEMALVLGCDIEEIVAAKLERASKKYPARTVKGMLGSAKYREIKKQYRSKK